MRESCGRANHSRRTTTTPTSGQISSTALPTVPAGTFSRYCNFCTYHVPYVLSTSSVSLCQPHPCPLPNAHVESFPGARAQGPGTRPTCSEHAIFATARRRLNTPTPTPTPLLLRCNTDPAPIMCGQTACGLLQVRNRIEHLQFGVLLCKYLNLSSPL